MATPVPTPAPASASAPTPAPAAPPPAAGRNQRERAALLLEVGRGGRVVRDVRVRVRRVRVRRVRHHAVLAPVAPVAGHGGRIYQEQLLVPKMLYYQWLPQELLSLIE